MSFNVANDSNTTSSAHSNLVAMLENAALSCGDNLLYRFLDFSQGKDLIPSRIHEISYKQFHIHVKSLAALIQTQSNVGDRALLIYEPGLGFITSFMACIYAGVLAVPVYPPKRMEEFGKLEKILSDSQPNLFLLSKQVHDHFEQQGINKYFKKSSSSSTSTSQNSSCPTKKEMDMALQQQLEICHEAFEGFNVLVTDALKFSESNNLMAFWKQPENLSTESLAFLQYTSGSTSDPKGVMLTHGNLLHNSHVIEKSFGHTNKSHGMIWLPPYHDMGLIGGLLQVIYAQFSCTLMSPFAFIECPLRWLLAVSQYSATTCGGPNFAYQLCVKYFLENKDHLLMDENSRQLLASVNLSSWDVAFVGAEPIREETLERFYQVFREYGFKKESFYPCYGLAESTLFVSGVEKGKGFDCVTRQQMATTLSKSQQHSSSSDDERKKLSQKFVNCGKSDGTAFGQILKIVDPESGTELTSDDQEGEIWLKSPSVAKGYWKKPEITQEIFHARLNGIDITENSFLKTGDLGFVKNGQLFITGRRKDLIIINGLNYYPQDIEFVVSESHEKVRRGCVVSFSIEVNGNENFVVVAETKATESTEFDNIIHAMRKAIVENLGVSLYCALACIILMKPHGLQKTTSGKVRRQPTKGAFLNNKLNTKHIVHRWDRQSETEEDTAAQLPHTPTEIQLAKVWKDVLNTGTEPYLNSHFLLQGGSSIQLIQLQTRIQQQFHVNLSLSKLLTSPTLQAMAKVIEQEEKESIETSSIIAMAKERPITIPLSYSQQRFWFLHHLIADAAIHNVFSAVRMKGKLDMQALTRSLMTIMDRHESLRSCFPEYDSSPYQFVHEKSNFTLREYNLQHFMEETSREEEANRILLAEVKKPFTLQEAPLVRGCLIQMSKEEHILALTFHHIIIDGWSMSLLIEDFTRCYNAYKHHQQQPLLADRILQYPEYTIWQHENLQREDKLEKQLAYWEHQLKDLPNTLKLPAEQANVLSGGCFEGAHYRFKIDAPMLTELKILTQSQHATLFMGLLALFNVLLFRYCDETDLVVGSPVVNRQQHVELESMVGLMVNTLVLRNQVDPNAGFIGLLARAKQTVLSAFENQEVPFQQVVDRLKVPRDSNENPLFQVMLAMHSPLREVRLDELCMEPVFIDNGTSMFHLTLEVQEMMDGALACSFEYRTDLFNASTIERMATNFVVLLQSAIKEPQRPIKELPLVGEAERHQLLEVWNERISPPNKLLHQLVEEQARKTPNNIALLFGDQTCTYEVLNAKANQLALRLREISLSNNGGNNPFIAISMERSFELLVGLLAILKSGHAYLPLDPTYPEERLQYMLMDSQAGILLTHSCLNEKFSSYQGNRVFVDKLSDDLSLENVESNVNPDDLAYLIYTSGSTGKPKGAMLTHRNVVNTLTGLVQLYEMQSTDKFIHYSSYSFDVSLEELFLPLVTGATVVIAKPNIQYQLEDLVDLIYSSKATLFGITPSLWHGLSCYVDKKPHSMDSLRIITIGNEPVDPRSVQEIQNKCPNATVLNVCGGTETCIDWSLFKIPRNFKGKVVPIGRALPGVQLYVLDSSMQPVPIGVPGELYVGGHGVGRGYWRNTELTAKSFIENPFATEEERMNGMNLKLFKTGDLVRFLPDGNLVYLSRMDHQIKIRGFRVELGEIENVMRQSGMIHEAVVILNEDPNFSQNKQLLGYILCKEGEQRDRSTVIRDLLEYLEKHLPYYMIPSKIKCIQYIPITSNGKLDRKGLPIIDDDNNIDSLTKFEPPETQAEIKLREIWAKVLKTKAETISAHDNFFAIGGNSILMAQVRSLISDEFGVLLDLATFFKKRTLHSLANLIQSSCPVQQ
ncbi:hypothetical protein C9374_004134 [Naegleria lovaniensis]|uniref:Carrier domain-containing protein n=1 Tax=Naegleria lovaniensis TaxID=51637 RepID=A0AA88KKU5_NAELO|nr:uncharacterized protein C9374_004134 [Naegleria lovaniensis]KAG2383463.1 hypothetical protein C9374_004134 [Naegleria lovaniensis]